MRFPTSKHFPDTLTPVAGVLYKRRPLDQAARAKQLVDEAKCAARRLVRDADCERQTCIERAATLGYHEGFTRAIEQLVECMEQVEKLRMALRTAILREARVILEEIFGDPDLLLRITEAAINCPGRPNDHTISLLIPKSAMRVVPTLRERLKTACTSYHIKVSDTPTFVVEWDDIVFEFDPHDVAKEVSDAALKKCSAIANTIESEVLMVRVLKGAMHRLEQGGSDTMDAQQSLSCLPAIDSINKTISHDSFELPNTE